MALFRSPIIITMYCIVLAVALTTPGCGMFPSKDGIIGQVVETGNSYRSEIGNGRGCVRAQNEAGATIRSSHGQKRSIQSRLGCSVGYC